jgi:hypothetical protein
MYSREHHDVVASMVAELYVGRGFLFRGPRRLTLASGPGSGSSPYSIKVVQWYVIHIFLYTKKSNRMGSVVQTIIASLFRTKCLVRGLGSINNSSKRRCRSGPAYSLIQSINPPLTKKTPSAVSSHLRRLRSCSCSRFRENAATFKAREETTSGNLVAKGFLPNFNGLRVSKNSSGLSDVHVR